jgi:hypothetical protein
MGNQFQYRKNGAEEENWNCAPDALPEIAEQQSPSKKRSDC